MFKQMRYFISVVDTKSFTKAAEECYISQSAISQQIKSLEDQLGVKLLKRQKKSFLLTPSGEYFYTHAKEILEEVDKICEKAKEIEEDENVLKIGYLRGYHASELKEAIVEFSKIYPDVTIELRRGNHEELYDLLMEHEVNIVISDQRRVFHDDYVNYHLRHMECYIEVSRNSPLYNKKYVDVDELKDQTCIIVSSLKQQEIEQDFYENIIGLKCRYTFVESIEEARLLISINRGFMPIEYASDPCEEYIVALMHNDQQILRNYCAFWKKSETNYYIEEFAKLLKKVMHADYHK